MQLKDLEKRKRELESETEEQRIAREKKRAELAALALNVGQKISTADQAKADEAGGSERMVAQPVTATLAQVSGAARLRDVIRPPAEPHASVRPRCC